MLTRKKLILCMPKVPDPDLWLTVLRDVVWDTDSLTVPRCAALLAQLGHESGDCRWLEELGDGKAYEDRKDLGNTHPGDGPKYKGRGIIQLTGRRNYSSAGDALGLPLEDRPDMAKDPHTAGKIAAWYWNTHGCGALADIYDFDGVTWAINGGLNGIADRRGRYLRALHALSLPAGK